MEGKTFVKKLGSVFLATFVVFQVSAQQQQPNREVIRFMAYNVENLFDAVHDAGKDDIEFLAKSDPLKKQCASNPIPYYRQKCFDTDWNSSRLALKLNQIKRVVTSEGYLPDILAIVEVENIAVTKMFAKTLGYEFALLTTSPDARGIDVGLLFNKGKVSYESMREIPVTTSQTRNILEVIFRLNKDQNTRLAVYVNHWPSQGSDTSKRMGAAKALRGAIEQVKQHFGEGVHVLAAGDFNTIKTDKPHPIKTVITTKGWQNRLHDLYDVYEAVKPWPTTQPPGTYFYGKEASWNRLDLIMVSENLIDGTHLDANVARFHIVAPPFASRGWKVTGSSQVIPVPAPYDFNSDSQQTAGFSDHYPIAVDLLLK